MKQDEIAASQQVTEYLFDYDVISANRNDPQGYGEETEPAEYDSYCYETPPSNAVQERIGQLTESIRQYEAWGWRVLNAPPVWNKDSEQYEAQKGPRTKNWTTAPPSHDEVVKKLMGYQGEVPENLVLLTGTHSNNLVAIDIDSEEAWIAFKFLMERSKVLNTGMIRTRPSAPYRGQFFYVVDETLPSVQYNHPASDKEQSGVHVEILAEKRCALVPPSIHPVAGDQFLWNRDSIAELNPTSISSKSLQKSVDIVAAAAMLGREMGRHEGTRQEIAMAIAGTLARAGWADGDTRLFLASVSTVAKDEEMAKRLSVVQRTYDALQAGKPVTGLPKLKELLGEPVAEKFVVWLSLKSVSDVASSNSNEPAEDWKPRNIKLLLSVEPPQLEWIFNDLMPRGIVAGLAATGGTGKSMLLLQLAISLSAGKVLLPFFAPKCPMKVMLFLGEDPEDIQRRRFHLVGKWAQLSSAELDLLYANLYFYPYRGEPLIDQASTQENPTPRYRWMKNEVLRVMPDLVMLDPRSRWAAIDENNNDLATRFISLLENLVAPCNGSILLSHHVGKSNATNMSSHSPRGASAFTDGVRLLINMVPESDEKHSSESSAGEQFVSLQVTKSNYSARSTKRVRLRQRRELEGILEEYDPQGSQTVAILNAIIEELDEKGSINASGLFDPHKETDKDFVGALNERIRHTVAERKSAVEYGVKNGLLERRSEKTAGKPAIKIGLPVPPPGEENVVEAAEAGSVYGEYDF